MAKKKSMRAKVKKSSNSSNAPLIVSRKTAFIPIEDGPDRVLPREIRENTYRYLPLGRHVKKPRGSAQWKKKGYADYYDFQVNILLAKKAIYAEAREVLYRENNFAVLSAKEKVIGVRIASHAVPVVSHNFYAVERFSEHILFMRFEGLVRGSIFGHTEVCNCPKCTNPPKEERMLLLADDLPAFVRICRVISHMDLTPTFTVIDSPRDEDLKYYRPSSSRRPCVAKIEFRKNSFHPFSSSFVEEILVHFRKVIGERQVKIVAPNHAKLAAATEKAMMPKVVWAYAAAWDLVEVMREMKADADEIVKMRSADPTDTDKLACILYDGILMFSGNSMIFRLRRDGKDPQTDSRLYCRPSPANGKCLDWIESWFLVSLDLAIASSLLNQFSGSDKEAKSHADDAQRFMHFTCHAPPETAAHLFHVLAFVHAKKRECSEVFSALERARFTREMSKLGPDPGLEQDYEKQVRHMTVCSTVNEKRQQKICLCCSSFAGKTYVARNSTFERTKPAGLAGWQDLHHQLAELDFSTMGLTKKDAPPQVQMQHQAPVFPHAPLYQRDFEDIAAEISDLGLEDQFMAAMSVMGFMS